MRNFFFFFNQTCRARRPFFPMARSKARSQGPGVLAAAVFFFVFGDLLAMRQTVRVQRGIQPGIPGKIMSLIPHPRNEVLGDGDARRDSGTKHNLPDSLNFFIRALPERPQAGF